MSKRDRMRILDRSNKATREARAKLAAAGALSTAWKPTPDMPIVVDEDEMFDLPPGSPTLDELQDWTRGESEE